PWQAIYRVGGPGGGFEGDQKDIPMSGTPRLVNWVAPGPRSVICSARIQLTDGRWVGPTRLYPYATPTPIGGEYQTQHGSRVRTAIITAARSPVPPGASCNYPLFSGLAVDGYPSQRSDTKDFTVQYKFDSQTNPDTPGALTTFQAEVSVSNPRLIMCHLFVSEIKGSGRTYRLNIGPHGGLSSRLTLESRIGFGILGYARLAR
ncbi:MAG TPA: hypothetical protein VIC06_03075, partial [Solirubrobacteraceae bacterium]